MTKINTVKKYALIMIAAMIMGLATGCTASGVNNDPNQQVENNTDNTDNPELTLSAKEIADKLLAEGDFKDQLAEVDAGVAVGRLYELEADKISDSMFYTNTNATAEEIAVVKASADYLDIVLEAYNKRVADQKEACVDYLPDEMPKLEKAVVVKKGDYAILCISCDSAKAESIINALGSN